MTHVLGLVIGEEGKKTKKSIKKQKRFVDIKSSKNKKHENNFKSYTAMIFTLFVSALVSPRFVRVRYQSPVTVQKRQGKDSAFQSENRTCSGRR